MIPGSLTVRVIGTPVGLTFAAAVIVTLPVPMVNWFPVTETLAAADTVTVETGGSERMRVDSSGKVGIGVTPQRHLHINGGNESTKIQITNQTTGSGSDGDGFQLGIATNGTANIEQREKAFSGAVVHDFFNILCVLIFLPIELISKFIYHWSAFLTTHMDHYEGGTFKSPLKIIVSPLITLIIQVDKKKIKKISQNEMTSQEAGSLIKGGFMEGMDDTLAGFICLAVSLLLLCVFLYGLVTFLKNTLQGMGDKCINYSLRFSNTWWGGYLNILIGTLFFTQISK